MGVEALAQALEEEVRARSESILREAREEAARIRHAAEQEWARRSSSALAARESELRREAQERVAAERRAARDRVLRARAALLERVLARASERLPEACASESWRAALPGALARALAHVQRPAVVEVDAERVPDAERALAGLPDGAGLAGGVCVEASASPLPGFRVRGSDGRVVVDESLATRLELEAPRLAIDILRDLENAR